jgi:anti-sigma factor RsiW
MSDDRMRDDMYDDENGTLPPACAAFDESLPDYLDGTLEPAARSAAEAHRAGCDRCAALVADLENISAAARALPPIVPSAETTSAIWRGVSERIAAPAVSIGSARTARRIRFDGWRRQLTAAAALVLVTAGATYLVTRSLDRADREQVASSGTVGPVETLKPVGPVIAPVGPSTTVASGDDSTLDSARIRGPQPGGGQMVVVRNPSSPKARRPSATATYEQEIHGLGRILDERRGDLDSATVAVLEKNLAVIDQAIQQSRAALARDPRSRFLDQQLNSALDKKVELLRTAALLPART